METEKVSRAEKQFQSAAIDILKDWIEHTTSHGLANMLRTKNWFIRSMWLIIYLFFLGYCSSVIVKSVREFYENKTTVSTEYVRETPSPFPAVTFCNVNAFNEQKALGYILNKTEGMFDFDCIQNLTVKNITNLLGCTNATANMPVLFANILAKIKRSIINDNLTHDELENLGFSFRNDMLLNCDFNGIRCPDDWFHSFWHNEFGLCHTFNSGKNSSILKTSAADPNNGLFLELIVEPPIETIFSYRSGLYALIHNQSTIPTTMSGAIFVPTQFETYIGMTRTFTTKKASPYSDCIKDLTPFSEYSRKLFSYIADMNITYYDQIMCLDFCYQDIVTKNCNCCTSSTSCIKGMLFCATDEQILCEIIIQAQFSTGNTNKICENVCQEQCDSQIFSLSISSTTFPTESYYYILRDIFYRNREFQKSSLLKLIVNYADLSYTKITVSPAITFEALIGNVGGQLGLFIGISLLSLLEIVELTVELTLLAYRKFTKIKVNP